MWRVKGRLANPKLVWSLEGCFGLHHELFILILEIYVTSDKNYYVISKYWKKIVPDNMVNLFLMIIMRRARFTG